MVLSKGICLNLDQIATLKYGDNPHQNAYGVYSIEGFPEVEDPFCFDQFVQIEGAPLGKTNLLDIATGVLALRKMASAFEKMFQIRRFFSVGLKHANPCGACFNSDAQESLKGTIQGDPVDLFGGTVVTTFEIGEAEALSLRQHLTEPGVQRILDVVAAPSITKKAREILSRKGGACKMLINPNLATEKIATMRKGVTVSTVLGHLILEETPSYVLDLTSRDLHWEEYEYCSPGVNHWWSEARKADLMLAWAVGSSSLSNSVTLAKKNRIVANGIGQTSRVGAVRVALMKAQAQASGCLGYSDSFFPFEDGPQLLVNAGITHVFTSTGSIRDEQALGVFRKNRVALCTGPDKIVRGFRH